MMGVTMEILLVILGLVCVCLAFGAYALCVSSKKREEVYNSK